MVGNNELLAARLRACTEALMARRHGTADLAAALEFADALYAQLLVGSQLSLEDRQARFMDQMMNVGTPRHLDVFEPFTESPVSGSINPLSPIDITIIRDGDRVRATVTIGVAMEGAPGRSHGGIIAALFDDIMGALQLVIDKSGYTRSLMTEYLAALPVGEPVEFLAYEIDAEPGLFGVEAEAWAGGRMVARSTGIFTRIAAGGFMKPANT